MELIQSKIVKYKEVITFLPLIILIGLQLTTTWIKLEASVGIAAGLISFYFGLLKEKIENDKLFKELFSEFNARYNGKVNDLLNRLRDNTSAIINPKEEVLVIDYFNLCAEEYLWFKKGRIPKDVWDAWKAGILANIEIQQVKEIYLKEINTLTKQTSYYGLVKELGIKN